MGNGIIRAIAVVSVISWPLTSSASSVHVWKTFDPEWDKGPHYNTDLGNGCTIYIEFGKDSSGAWIHTGLNAQCNSELENFAPAVEGALDAASRDGIKFAYYKSFFLGGIEQPEWRERFAECYVARFGLDDRRGPQDPESWKFIDKCDVFRELTQLFAKQGVELHLDGIEKGDAIDLAKRNWGSDPSILPFVHDRGRHRGLVFVDGWMWFKLVPARA